MPFEICLEDEEKKHFKPLSGENQIKERIFSSSETLEMS